jgi:YD repeat-containing protein
MGGRKTQTLILGTQGERQRLAYTYDDVDRLLTVAANGIVQTRYQYDDYREHPWDVNTPYTIPLTHPIGQQTFVEHIDLNKQFNYQQQLGYDQQGHVVFKTVTLGTTTYQEAYAYTLDGTPNKLTNPFDVEIQYHLGRAQRLDQVTIHSTQLGGTHKLFMIYVMMLRDNSHILATIKGLTPNCTMIQKVVFLIALKPIISKTTKNIPYKNYT